MNFKNTGKFLLSGSFIFLFVFTSQAFAFYKSSCYKYRGIGELPKAPSIIKALQPVDVFVESNSILPFKYLGKFSKPVPYKVKELSGTLEFLRDKNPKTYLVLDTRTAKQITIYFPYKLKAGTFKIVARFDTKIPVLETNKNELVQGDQAYKVKFWISENGKDFFKVDSLHKLTSDFDVQAVKLKIIPRNPDVALKIKINELGFFENFYKYVVDAQGEVEAYADYACKDGRKPVIPDGNFAINISTPEIWILLKPNPKFMPIPTTPRDRDGDNVPDELDNCPDIFNPDQADTNANGIGDMCEDIDGDGIVSYKDNCPTVPNPDQKDVNNNGVGDACEFDKDRDGVPDAIDNCITVPNLDQKDSDGDRIGDACDNCEYYNPRQLDLNGNGIGDVCEEKQKFIKQNDKDKDGVLDFEDNCPTIPNPDQKDWDKDGIGDACDNCPKIDNPDQIDKNQNGIGDMCEDVDGDGYVSYQDNCPYIANPDQSDKDNDGIGDACEDEDKDNIPAAKDNCSYNYNPDQSDVDKDGIGDACDEKDDRFLESNKTAFVGLIVVVSLLFIIGIGYMVWQLQVSSKSS